MSDFIPTERTRVRQAADRARYDRAAVYAILDEALVCHVSFVVDGQPVVIPMSFGRDGDRLILHGSTKSRLSQALAAGATVCIAVTLLDGLVAAGSATHQSVNYRSVVLYGHPSVIADPAAKVAALRALVEHVLPGQWDRVRPPTEAELRAVQVIELPIMEASAKMRSGPPKEAGATADPDIWTGELPLALAALPPVASPGLPAGLEVPPNLARLVRPGGVIMPTATSP